jgi:hypothetical protein
VGNAVLLPTLRLTFVKGNQQMKPANTPPRAGDIYVQRSTDTNRYCAYQITHTENGCRFSIPNAIALLALDWIGDAPPTEAEINAMRPLISTRFYFSSGTLNRYGGKLDHCASSPPIPPTLQYVAHRAPFILEQAERYGGWPRPREQAAELEAEWRARDPERLRRFEAACDSTRTLEIGGQTLREDYAGANAELLDRLPNLAELDRMPRLLHIEARGPRPDLIAWLRTHDLLNHLTWNAHGQRTLDFRGVPHIRHLILDATGLETLHLHTTCRVLTLTGTLHPRLRIHAHDDGALLQLAVSSAIAAPAQADPGLPKLAELRIEDIIQLDLAIIAARHPALSVLILNGKPGTLQNFSAIARCNNLDRFFITDLFGYTPADFPPPAAWPRMWFLALSSVPAEVAAHVKKIYGPLKKSARLMLEVYKPRAPEWLADNLDNPFRSWDGSPHVTPANARRASALYKKTRAGLRAHLALPDAPQTLPAWLEALAREWAAAFNAWDKRTNWIETEEREIIFEVVETIFTDAARGCPGAKINVAALMEIFDGVREF